MFVSLVSSFDSRAVSRPKFSTSNSAEGGGRLKMQKIPFSADIFNLHCFVAAIETLVSTLRALRLKSRASGDADL